MTRGLRRGEAATVWIFWLFAAVMFGASVLTTPTIAARSADGVGGLAPSLLPILGMTVIGVLVVRAGFATLRLARTRSLLAHNPEAWLGVGPYREVMLADEDLVRLSRKVGKLCEAEAATNPAFLHFLHEYSSFLEGYEPGVMRHREKARRLEGVADWVLERKRQGEPTTARRRRGDA